jgi:hypothetical protein
MRALILVFATLVCALFVGCAKPPQEQIDTANKAVAAAKGAKAPEYAPDEMNAVETAMSEAMAEVEKQKKTIFFSRNYEAAKQKLGDVVAKADAAVAAAKKGEELAMARAAEKTKADAEATVNKVYNAYRKAKKKARRAAARALLAEAMNLLKEAQTAMKEEKYSDAVEAAHKAEAKLAEAQR